MKNKWIAHQQNSLWNLSFFVCFALSAIPMIGLTCTVMIVVHWF